MKTVAHSEHEASAARILELRARSAWASVIEEDLRPEVFATVTFKGDLAAAQGLALTRRWLDRIARVYGHVHHVIGWGAQRRGAFHAHVLMRAEHSMLGASPFALVEGDGQLVFEPWMEFDAVPAWRRLRHGAHDILVEAYDGRRAAAYLAKHVVEVPSIACPRRAPCTRRLCARSRPAA
jgi:hypothetical protein